MACASASIPAGHADSGGCATRTGSGFVRFVLGFLLAYTTWAWAGLRPSFHWVGVGAAVVLLAGLVRFSGRALVRDPLFYAGLAFLGLLAIQWANAGRVQYFDVGYQKWMYLPPRWPHWPFAFAREDALQMLTWFFPAWVIVWAFRARRWSRREARGILFFLAYNAGALAIFGLVQMISGTEAIYWVRPLKGHFFASFPYGNHVGPFFVMVAALGGGLLLDEVLDKRDPATDHVPDRDIRTSRVLALAATVLLCLAAAILGFSRTGIILTVVLLLLGVGYSWARGWGLLTPAGRVNAVALALGGLAVLFFLVMGVGEKGIRKEISMKKMPSEMSRAAAERIDWELGGRPRFVRAAASIWREQPWFGWGGWGYKYRVADHVSPELWGRLEKGGWANVHVDILQYLAEFGVVGVGLLLCALAAMLFAWLKSGLQRGALWTMGGCGLALTAVASLVDIPFRSPAILYTWLAILAAIPPACGWQTHHRRLPLLPNIPERTC